MSKGSSDQFNGTIGSKKELIEALRKQGEKFNEKRLIFITRDINGKIVWLEEGNPGAGFYHMTHDAKTHRSHSKQLFNQFGINEKDIPHFIQKAIQSNKFIEDKKRGIRYYNVKGNDTHYLSIVVGSNGYIITAFPTRKSKIKRRN